MYFASRFGSHYFFSSSVFSLLCNVLVLKDEDEDERQQMATTATTSLLATTGKLVSGAPNLLFGWPPLLLLLLLLICIFLAFFGLLLFGWRRRLFSFDTSTVNVNGCLTAAPGWLTRQYFYLAIIFERKLSRTGYTSWFLWRVEGFWSGITIGTVITDKV